MPDQDGLRFLFDIQDKITAKLAKIEAKAKASANKIDSYFTKSSRSQQTHSARLAAMEEKRVAQGKILAQRLSSAKATEARRAANFSIAAARREQVALDKANRKVIAASKTRLREVIANVKARGRAEAKAAREAAKAAKDHSNAVQAIARKTVLAMAGVLGAISAVGVKLVALGSDAEETENVTGLAFGDMKGAAEDWARNFAAATGSSRFESIELVSDLGLIVKGMGFTEEASLGMSSRMVELAADMASAKNVPLDVALDKIRAGLIGESEPLRTMGVLLSEARVKQEAYSSGLAETGTELTNTQKVQARMNIILADSAAMHGDLINTQGSVANQWRAIKNQVFDAATALGQKLLPVASDVLGVLGEWVTKGADLITWITESEGRMQAFGAIVAGVVVTGLGLAAAALWAMVPAVAAATGGISLIIPAIAAGVGALVAGWILFGDTIKDFLRKVWNKYLENIGKGLKTLSKFVGIFHDEWAEAMAAAGEGLQDTAADMGKTEKATVKLAKEQTAATKVTVKATKEQTKAAKAARKSAEAVQGLLDSWTGATLQSKEFLKAFKKLTPEQKKNDRIMDQVLDKYSAMRKVLGPFNKELEAQWQATERLNPELAAQRKETEKLEAAAKKLAEKALADQRKETEKLEKAAKKLAEKALAEVTKEQERLKKAAEELNARLESQRRRLLNLPTDEQIRESEELTLAWESLTDEQRAGEGVLGRYNAALDTINGTTQEATESASGYELALAGIAGGMGGATGKALNLVIAMREHNKEQRAAAKAGKETEAEFSTMQQGAAGLAFAFMSIGDAIGGTAGKILSELGGIAQAFATGGIVAAIIAGVGSLIRGLKSLFGASKMEKEGRKVAHAFRQGIIAGLSEAQTAEVQLSWDQGWDSSVIIAVRDALIETGVAFDAARARGQHFYDALWRAEKQGPEAVQRVMDEIQAIVDKGQALETLRRAWLNLPTDQVVADFEILREVWENLNVEDRGIAFEKYAKGLLAAREAGIALSEAELEALGLFEQHQALVVQQAAAMKAAKALQAAELAAMKSRQDAEMAALRTRQDAEMAGIDTQIDAIESRLRPKISELQALIDQQDAEMAALSARQDAEMAALATRRQAALDSIQATQAEQLSILKETQRKELDEMKAAQAAELSALKAARAAALGVVEAAIQRELEDERIAAQLKIDLRKAGSDQEAIDAAHARAATATERLLERDELDDLMEEAEKRVRARYKDELDAINNHWDEKEAATLVRHKDELTALEDKHGKQMTALETSHALELAMHNAYWDALETLMTTRHATELAAMEAAHTAQLEALLDSLKDKRAAMAWFHHDELFLLGMFHTSQRSQMEAAHAAELTAIEKHWKDKKDAIEAGIAAIQSIPPPPALAPAPVPTPVQDDPTWGYGGYGPYGGYGGYGPYMPGRQHGGPVSAGRAYRVGEAGPETFVPSQSGRIEPNGSRGGTVDPRILARAIKDALQDTSVQVDGRRLGRLTVRHQPLAVTELGGRR